MLGCVAAAALFTALLGYQGGLVKARNRNICESISCGPGSYVAYNCSTCIPCQLGYFKTFASNDRNVGCTQCNRCYADRGKKMATPCSPTRDISCVCAVSTEIYDEKVDVCYEPKHSPKPTTEKPFSTSQPTPTVFVRQTTKPATVAFTSTLPSSSGTPTAREHRKSVSTGNMTKTPAPAESKNSNFAVTLIIALSVVGGVVLIVIVVVVGMVAGLRKKIKEVKTDGLEEDPTTKLLQDFQNSSNKVINGSKEELREETPCHGTNSDRDKKSDFRGDDDVLSLAYPVGEPTSTQETIKFVRQIPTCVKDKIGVQLSSDPHINKAYFPYLAEQYGFSRDEIARLRCRMSSHSHVGDQFFVYLQGHKPNLTVKQFCKQLHRLGRIDLSDDIREWIKEEQMRAFPTEEEEDDRSDLILSQPQ